METLRLVMKSLTNDANGEQEITGIDAWGAFNSAGDVAEKWAKENGSEEVRFWIRYLGGKEMGNGQRKVKPSGV